MTSIIWNQESIKITKQYINNYLKDQSMPNFLLLTGPKNIWKSTTIKEIAKVILKDFFQNDFLQLEDLSEELEKKHTIKVTLSKDKNKHYITKKDNSEKYYDIWTREVNERLQRSSTWKTKILFIENLERMNTAAMNAFLKTCEEPLPNRIIIATSSNHSLVLDTIHSRAIHIRYSALSPTDIQKVCNQNNLFIEEEKIQQIIWDISLGKPWIIFKYNNIFQKNPEIKKDILTLITLLEKKENINKAHKLLISIKNLWIINDFLDGRIHYATKKKISTWSWIKVKKMINANINQDNLLLYWLINQ